METPDSYQCPRCGAALEAASRFFWPSRAELLKRYAIAAIAFLVLVGVAAIYIVWVAFQTFRVTGSRTVAFFAILGFMVFFLRQCWKALPEEAERYVCLGCEEVFSERHVQIARLARNKSAP